MTSVCRSNHSNFHPMSTSHISRNSLHQLTVNCNRTTVATLQSLPTKISTRTESSSLAQSTSTCSSRVSRRTFSSSSEVSREYLIDSAIRLTIEASCTSTKSNWMEVRAELISKSLISSLDSMNRSSRLADATRNFQT